MTIYLFLVKKSFNVGGQSTATTFNNFKSFSNFNNYNNHNNKKINYFSTSFVTTTTTTTKAPTIFIKTNSFTKSSNNFIKPTKTFYTNPTTTTTYFKVPVTTSTSSFVSSKNNFSSVKVKAVAEQRCSDRIRTYRISSSKVLRS